MSTVETLLVIPLGEAQSSEVQEAVASQFGAGRDITWLDRNQLRRRPIRALAGLLRHRYRDAVLVTPDLRQSRLRLTSFVLGLIQAQRRWQIDLRGERDSWTLRGHTARNAWPVVRHALACVAALAIGEAVLQMLDRLVKPREMKLSRPKRMLYLRSQLWLGLQGGGSVAHTAGVIGGLQQADVDVHVVSSDRLPGVNAPTRVQPPEMWFDGWLRELEDVAYNVAFGFAALRQALRMRPDAIYQRHTAFNCAGAVVSRVLNVPLVLEFNSSELWKGRFWGGLRLRRVAELVERINLHAADRVVVVSRVLRDQLVAGGVRASKVVVNPNGVDPARFRPDVGATAIRKGLKLEASVVVGFSGTFGAWHGIPTLSKAVPLVLAERADVHWLLIGDGPLRPLIEIAPRVQFAGMVPHAEMPDYLATCDILVSPHGRQADGAEFFGSPTKLYEYMAMGKPIVASAVGQITDVLVDGESALLVPPDDPDALARAIVRLVDDACLRARLGQAARQAAEERHTWRSNAERVLDSLGAA